MSKIRNIQGKAIIMLPSGLRKSALVTLAILVCAALSAGVLARFGVIGRAGVQSQSSAVVAHLGSEGFTPPETTRAAGTFTLTIEREGTGAQVFQLKRDGEQAIMRELTVPAGESSLSEELDLVQGGYVLRAVDNPAWLFHLTLQ